MRRTHSGIFGRFFHLHSIDYARERIAQICTLGAVCFTRVARSQSDQGGYLQPPVRRMRRTLVTAHISQTGSCLW